MIETSLHIFTEPLAFAFMQRALLSACMVASVCAVFSCFLVLRGWSLMGDAVSHAVLPGLVLAYVIGWPLSVGAFLAGLGCAFASGYLKAHSRVKEDAVMGIVFSGMFALGLVLLTRIETDLHLMHILFGNVLGVSWADIAEIAIIAGGALLVLLIRWRDFMLYCFDPVQASLSGLSVTRLHFGLLILLSMTIVAALKAVGIILVIAMLIAPGAIAFLLVRRFQTMMLVAWIVSMTSCISGVFLSFYLDVAPAPLIVVIQGCIFVVILMYALSFKSLVRPSQSGLLPDFS
jgi:manganese/iron transport system permease protein